MGLDAKAFLEALDEIKTSKGISEQVVIQGLKDTIKKAYRRELGGEDADVRITIDVEKGIIDLVQAKEIIEDGEVEDDFLQISLQEAKELEKADKGYIQEARLHYFETEEVDGVVQPIYKAIVERYSNKTDDTNANPVAEILFKDAKSLDDNKEGLALIETNTDEDGKEVISGKFYYFTGYKTLVNKVVNEETEVQKIQANKCVKNGLGVIEDERFIIPASVHDFRKAAAMSVKSMMRQKFAEAEKNVLYEQFKGKIKTLVTGRVEKVEERAYIVTIGRASVFLPKKQLIGDEYFNVGDHIKLYVNSVDGSAKGGANLVVTRTSEGFLECLFNEEIPEIKDKTIEIKKIAREAGERSKVAVFSNNPTADPAGACIGSNGSRIQVIVGQLGNNILGDRREKVDIITYSENTGLYIMESLKPAKVAGIILNKEERHATVIVEDDSLSLAIGRKGVNVRLAVKLTDYRIDIKTKTDAINEGLEYVTFEQLEAIDMVERNKKAAELALSKQKELAASVLPGAFGNYVAPDERVYADEEADDEVNESLLKQIEKEEIIAPIEVETVENNLVNEEVNKDVKEQKVLAEPNVTEEVLVKTEVKTTTSLEELEKNLANETNKNKKTESKKFTRKKKVEEEEEDSGATIINSKNAERMAIYTDEELEEIRAEEEANDNFDDDDYEDEEDYSEYYE